jgi:hypothetical protein
MKALTDCEWIFDIQKSENHIIDWYAENEDAGMYMRSIGDFKTEFQARSNITVFCEINGITNFKITTSWQ